jgi:hypothetical protein
MAMIATTAPPVDLARRKPLSEESVRFQVMQFLPQSFVVVLSDEYRVWAWR